jgi:hypothetical protein
MDEISDLYADLEKEELQRKAKMTKAEKIRNFVNGLPAFVGKKRLLLDAVFKLANERRIDEKPLNRSYFKQVVNKEWSLEEDDHSNLWIRVDQPKRKKYD